MISNQLMVKPEQEHPYTTVKHYKAEVKAAIYNDFMTTDMDLVEIALKNGVSKDVVATWSRTGGWLEKKRAIEQELMRAADDKFRVFVTENKLPILRRQVRISGKLECAIEQVVEEELKNPTGKDGRVSDTKLKRMAEALAAVTGVSTKAVGMADTIVQNNGGGGGRQALVQIGVMPTVPAERTCNGPVIEVQEVDL